MVPQVFDGPGETTITVVQARSLSDGPPAVAAHLGVQGEVDAHRFASVVRGGVTRPRSGDHETGTGGQPASKAFVDPDV